MASLLALSYVHLVLAVVLIGYALFWLVMAFAMRREGVDMDSGEMLSLVGRSRWPPFVVPYALRIPMLALGWILVLLMVASGVLLVRARGGDWAQLASGGFWGDRFGIIVATKAVLVLLFAVAHARLSVRPTARAALLGAILAWATICASAFL